MSKQLFSLENVSEETQDNKSLIDYYKNKNTEEELNSIENDDKADNNKAQDANPYFITQKD